MNTKGNLYLIPVPISNDDLGHHIPEYNKIVVHGLIHFVAENEKPARKFLKQFGYPNIQQAQIKTLNEHTNPQEIKHLLEPVLHGQNVALMSDAGCPAIADPGSELVKLAHQNGIRVIPLSGPSSILQAIMGSGFGGQNFSFVGYLPVDKNERVSRIKQLEQIAIKQKQSQFFIETPYRNIQLFEALINTLQPNTLLFVGKQLTSPGQLLITRQISEWKKITPPDLNKVPVVFGIYT